MSKSEKIKSIVEKLNSEEDKFLNEMKKYEKNDKKNPS